MSHKTHMHDHGESYSGIGPTKRPNKSGEPPAEVVEGRPLTKENVNNLIRAGHRAREAGQAGWTACAKQQGRTGSYGSPLYCTTLQLICYEVATSI